MIVSNLNSILLEGNVVVADEVLRKAEGMAARYDFRLVSERVSRNKQNQVEKREEGLFEVEARGKLAEWCRVECRVGRGVRLVGRLAQEQRSTADGSIESHVYIIAEHIEFRASFASDADVPDDAA
jgi:single-strand DNA-binding protein